MPLVYFAKNEALFLWDGTELPRAMSGLLSSGEPTQTRLLTPEGVRDVSGSMLPLLPTMSALAATPAADVETLPASVATWVLASKLAIEFISNERIVPTITRHHGRIEARWSIALVSAEDALRLVAVAQSMPPAAHAVIVDDRSEEVWAPDALLRAYLDAVVDALVREARGGPALPAAKPTSRKRASVDPSGWEDRFRSALTGPQREFTAEGFGERSVVEGLSRWSEPALGARDRLRACFRLELPQADGDPFTLRFLLQSPDDPSLLLSAEDVWNTKERIVHKLGRAFRDPQESLLEALARAGRLFAPIGEALSQARPESISLDPARAWEFLGEGARLLSEAGFAVIVPSELTAAGQRRLRLRMRVGGKSSKVAGAVAGAAGLALEELLAVDWEAVIGDQALSERELSALAKHKAPLVRFRGAWVAVDPHELGQIQERLARGSSRMGVREAVRVALAGETQQGQLSVAVATAGPLTEMIDRLRNGSSTELGAPKALRATLRPYQERGLNWLVTMSALGLGACLADDMGLGKTMQLLAFVLRHAERAHDFRPALLVAPTSVLGNWERESERFAPSLRIFPHYGSKRARKVEDFPSESGCLVLTSYGLLRRDAALLTNVDWAIVALDEAQNIKNAASATTRAVRALKAQHRFALTGTPVENRLAELWSILEFANPGLLGPLDTFRREFALPIERYGNEDASARLRRIVSPFVLRRLKSDKTIIQDLPAKNEMKVVCTLTQEQATLYKAVVDEEMRRIDEAEGIERRGRVLALLTFTKQICNHPAQYLGEAGPLARRSGKLARITEMLEEALAAGDKALVFTQFREMGDRLTTHLAASLDGEVCFLHGGTPKKARDEMVRRFQQEPRGPRIFVLSVKAGGTGLNLTAANHVFHYDRWWNPAVEDQATDRAYRIGQKRAVQVHKLLCAGTVEEKIDRLLEQKRKLASQVVGAGEQWITELGSQELRELFVLSAGAVASEAEDEGAEAATATTGKARSRRKEAAR